MQKTEEMPMTEQLERLKELQDVLAEKYKLEAKVEELPKTLDGSTESLDRFKKEYIQRNTEYEEKKAQVAQLREELEEAQKKREEGEKGMDAVSTHREYEILQKQIDEATAIEDDKRKELQKEEKALEELNDILHGHEEFISSTEKDVNEQRENLDKEVSELNERLAELTDKENQMSEGINPEIIMKFQRIIRRNNKGIVAVAGNVCDGCHMVLPAQFANEVRHNDQIRFCPYCSRILFYDETIESTVYSLQSDELVEDTDEDLIDGEGFGDEIDDMENGDSPDTSSMDFEN
ncbi:MAG: C4-type zinc ribbon domain-containing protein [Spirochaetales bacterium]|nr:C4-type zinc ribbon domain-containing protein [Spirochaetales bacterium]